MLERNEDWSASEPDLPPENPEPTPPEAVPEEPVGPSTFRLWPMLAVCVVLVGTLVGMFLWQFRLPPPERPPSDIVKDAIAAHGGEEALPRLLVGEYTADAILPMGVDARSSATWVEVFELPKRYKRRIEGQQGGNPFLFEFVSGEDGGWKRLKNGEIVATPGFSNGTSMGPTLLTQLPNLLSKDVRLRNADGWFGDHETETVLAEKDGDRQTLHFDRKTHLLVSMSRRMPRYLTGEVVDGDAFLSDYTTKSGLTVPQRIRLAVGGKTLVDLKFTSLSFVDGHDDAVFDPPQPP